MKDMKDIFENHSKRTEDALSSSLSLSTNILSIDEILSPSKTSDNNNTNYADLEVDLDINNVSLNFDLSLNANTNSPIRKLPDPITKKPTDNHNWMNLLAATCRLYGRKRFESKFRVHLL